MAASYSGGGGGVSSSGGAGGAKVHVVARTKPTANFPHDIICMEDDGKVNT